MQENNFKTHFIYWILPSVITLSCILIFYLNLFGLSEFIAPEFNREFGIVENLQLLLLIMIFFLAVKGARTHKTKMEKYAYIVVAAATAFIFLEEIDYGLHYYDILTGRNKDNVATIQVFDTKVRNFHNNQNDVLDIMKLASYAVIAIFFVVLPLLPQKLKQKYPLLGYLSPTRYIVITAFCLLVLNQIARYLYKNFDYSNPSLNANVSEFEELMTYYIIFLYIREMIKKELPDGKMEKNKSDELASKNNPAIKD